MNDHESFPQYNSLPPPLLLPLLLLYLEAESSRAEESSLFLLKQAATNGCGSPKAEADLSLAVSPRESDLQEGPSHSEIAEFTES